jgi:hypothetical protein
MYPAKVFFLIHDVHVYYYKLVNALLALSTEECENEASLQFCSKQIDPVLKG